MNPWNTKNLIEIDVDIKNDIIEYIKKRKSTVLKNRIPVDKKTRIFLKKLYNEYGYKTIAKSLGITYTVCRSLIKNWAKIKTREGTDVVLNSTKKLLLVKKKKVMEHFY